jgi:uncharacterized membrane protein YagU involved in acid resistance
MNPLVRGLISGCLATVPMTAFMVLAHRKLPWWQRYALPPRQITRTLARKAGIAEQVNSHQISAATSLAHFGYGSAVGVPYATLVEPLPGSPPLKGAVYGLGVWAGSYLHLLPALDILYPATMHPRERNQLMIVAHLIWGASLGVVSAALRPSEQRAEPVRETRREQAPAVTTT